MELWIRSQNKKTLVKANAVTLSSCSNDYVIETDTCYQIGKYSKKRALEVLDEIQMYISENFTLGTISQIMGTQPRSRIVYEMPKK